MSSYLVEPCTQNKRFDPFHIREVGTLVIYSVLLLSCHSCLYDISALNAWIDKLYAILV